MEGFGWTGDEGNQSRIGTLPKYQKHTTVGMGRKSPLKTMTIVSTILMIKLQLLPVVPARGGAEVALKIYIIYIYIYYIYILYI